MRVSLQSWDAGFMAQCIKWSMHFWEPERVEKATLKCCGYIRRVQGIQETKRICESLQAAGFWAWTSQSIREVEVVSEVKANFQFNSCCTVSYKPHNLLIGPKLKFE